MFLDGFIHRLRDAGIPVGMTEVLDFYRGLERGLAPDLPSLFLFARLSFVRRAEHMDPFERLFVSHFYGVELPRVAPGDPELLYTPEFREWLRRQVEAGELPRSAPWTMDPEELMERFWETVREQLEKLEEHHGGSRWVGTGGTSPFGHSGRAPRGVRVHGESRHGSALRVIGERRYVDYAEDASLSGGNLRQALGSLKRLVPEGPRDALDVDATVRESARAGGEIELVFGRRDVDRLEVVLLIDNGGVSMLPWVRQTRLLFTKARDRFHRLTTYFFHNTVYGRVWSDPRRSEPVATEDLLRRHPPETRVLILGDASMAPEELLLPGWSIDGRDVGPEPSTVWLRRLRERFPHSVWLNPIPSGEWRVSRGHRTIAAIGEIFPMEELSLGGVRRAVERIVD